MRNNQYADFYAQFFINFVTKMQAVMNFRRKSTDGFSIGNILLDFFGGCTNYSQMIVQSIDQSMLFLLN